MSEIYVGKLEKKMSAGGKEYFKGWFGKVPVVAFWGKKDPNSINLKLDVSLAKYIDEQEDDPKDQPPAAQRNDDVQNEVPF